MIVRIGAALFGLTLIASAGSAASQTGAQPLGGPPMAGLCLLSKQAVIANAKVGAAATARLRQLADQAQATIDASRGPIEADAKMLESQRGSLKPAEYQSRRDALAVRLQALQQNAQARSRQIEVTRQQVLAQIAAALQPVIAQAYKARNCGLLVDRDAVLGGNMANDLTATVVQGIDARMSTISFGLAPLPANPAAAP